MGDVKFDKCNRLLVSSDGTGREEVIGEMIITLYHTEQCCIDTEVVQSPQDGDDNEVNEPTQDEDIYNHMIDDADDGSDDGADDTGKGLDDYGDGDDGSDDGAGGDGADDGVVLPADDKEDSGAFENKASYLVV